VARIERGTSQLLKHILRRSPRRFVARQVQGGLAGVDSAGGHNMHAILTQALLLLGLSLDEMLLLLLLMAFAQLGANAFERDFAGGNARLYQEPQSIKTIILLAIFRFWIALFAR